MFRIQNIYGLQSKHICFDKLKAIHQAQNIFFKMELFNKLLIEQAVGILKKNPSDSRQIFVK